ncbi:RbsD/FucU family protein [Paenibacillus sedimenti]|uniref:Fucose isomerase n=1 Tax=Paenibacillus sedimenti TaxID=2770274 RepID=A0A926KL97_9BACL|nr:RbsD/FucU domain-containing protein [Paenibacillus sedimenti]MBD0378861.1 fucose isomerase [Paenibacillus sedimenti]
MLKGIPSLLSPDLLKVLMEMGHGDELVLGDGNFPSASCAKRLIRADGHGAKPLLEAVLKLFPLDTSAVPVTVMQVDPGDSVIPVIWEDYKQIVQNANNHPVPIMTLERSAFYERCRNAFAVVATGESALYANVIIRKGIVIPEDK